MKTWTVPFTIKLDKGEGRSPGRHLSEVIRDLALKSRILDKKFADNDLDEHPERVFLGLAFEEAIAKQHPEICFHPGEIVVDGIAMSIDGASFNDGGISIFTYSGDGAVHEFKLTWKSSRRDIETEFMWLTQLKCYCNGMTASTGRPFLTGYLHVFWVNGNYSRDDSDPESGPRYKIWGFQFTPLELVEAWHMITQHAKTMDKKVPTKEKKRK